MARITYRKGRKGETITMRVDKGEDLRNVIAKMAKPADAPPPIAELRRAFEKAQRAESKAIEALPEKPTKAQSDRCWALAAATNAARDAYSKSLDAIESDGHIRDCGNGGDDPRDCSPACAKANARASLTRCPSCQTPTHASESDDDGRCVECMRAAGVEPITEGA